MNSCSAHRSLLGRPALTVVSCLLHVSPARLPSWPWQLLWSRGQGGQRTGLWMGGGAGWWRGRIGWPGTGQLCYFVADCVVAGPMQTASTRQGRGASGSMWGRRRGRMRRMERTGSTRRSWSCLGRSCRDPTAVSRYRGKAIISNCTLNAICMLYTADAEC